MFSTEENIDDLLNEIKELKIQLEESKSIIDAIKEGSVDALVLSKDGEQPAIYSLESADITYRVLIEKFSEGAVSLSETGLILFSNDYFAKLVESSADKLVGTYFHSLVDSVGQFETLRKDSKKGPTKGEIVLNISGTKLPVHISVTDLRPFVPAIGIIITDLSEKRKHEDDLALYQRKLESKINELNDTNAHLAQYVHVISHDIKAPLRKIMAYSGRLMESKSEHLKPAEQNYLTVISKASARLSSLVDDLTKYSLNTAKPELRPLDMNELIDGVLDDLEVIIHENKAVIKVDELPKLNASDFQMKQLFLNLLNNSIKFAKKGQAPVITISAEITDCVDMKHPNKKYHKLMIRDNGIGIEEQYLQKIFTIFQRLHTDEEYEGNGIGLAICRKIMDNHHGKIEAQSHAGEGTVFNLFFPVKK